MSLKHESLFGRCWHTFKWPTNINTCCYIKGQYKLNLWLHSMFTCSYSFEQFAMEVPQINKQIADNIIMYLASIIDSKCKIFSIKIVKSVLHKRKARSWNLMLYIQQVQSLNNTSRNHKNSRWWIPEYERLKRDKVYSEWSCSAKSLILLRASLTY